MTARYRVGALSELTEGEGLRVEVGDLVIAVFRVGTKLHAMGDACPHMGASMAEGFVDGNTVVCPWHGWVFDLDTGTSPFDEEARIPIYKVGVVNGDVFVEVDTEAPGTECPRKRQSLG